MRAALSCQRDGVNYNMVLKITINYLTFCFFNFPRKKNLKVLSFLLSQKINVPFFFLS